MNTSTIPIVMPIYGTRPEAIKLAPVIRALQDAADFSCFSVTTGQHRAMLNQVQLVFGLRASVELDVFLPGQPPNALLSKVLAKTDSILEAQKPQAVIVQGDTTTAAGAALAAFNRRVPVIHVEAGLRSGDLAAPFPEEGNRRLIGQIASLHLAPTQHARRALLNEGVPSRAISVTGNTVIDSLNQITRLPHTTPVEWLPAIKGERRIVLVTIHRRESWGGPLESVGRAIRRLARSHPNYVFFVPLHPNPVVRQSFLPHVHGMRNVKVMDPLDYVDFAHLMQMSDFVLTDSGGVQEEAPSLGKPVLVLRDNTERPEGVEAGTVKLVGTDEDRIVSETEVLISDPVAYARMAMAANPYGDGRATERSMAAIRHFFGRGERQPDFDSGLSNTR